MTEKFSQLWLYAIIERLEEEEEKEEKKGGISTSLARKRERGWGGKSLGGGWVWILVGGGLDVLLAERQRQHKKKSLLGCTHIINLTTDRTRTRSV